MHRFSFYLEGRPAPRLSFPLNKKYGSPAILVFFVLFATLALGQTKMSATESEALKAKVKSLANNTRTITSDFTQYKHLDFLSNDIESSGKLAFRAPDQVKWQYVKPYAYSIVFKNQTLYIDDEGNKSNIDVSGNKLFERLNHLIAASISGDMFDAEQFDMSFFNDSGKSLVHFMPKDPQFSEFISAFHITFNELGEVERVKMIEPSGDFTLIVFSNRKTNQPLSDAHFAQ
ncbi:outer membrane lipoprotein carrier protein LolA [Pseudozobellia thermophila]|uniref:Outer membrane lipoprotein carrier protein n=1 Tax=Pseudozobellia thermophila TaxID=192903 RepID=A0A1M6CKJ5_9FLAO|nr:outer membrane lipoprotein carrier protein LolA [Pseudozobellia thermophila]SHI61391.1 outer membrane lipoprotein carrier protein [Pseudozobellia thermophila]